MAGSIHVRGAREHNLQNVDVAIPRDSLTVITGLSGSGKSSLAFDTIYAEGQRRYVESLSAYARQFLELMGKPDVDAIDGLSPAISIEQKTTSKNPRSTVGTVTEIHDYMRLLWARVGVPYSPATGLPIEAQTVSQMVDRVLAMKESTRLLLLAPVVRDRKGEYRKELAELQRRGFTRVKVDGKLYEIGEVPALNRKLKHEIEAVVDRVVVRDGIAPRLADSFETALGLSDGVVYAEDADNGERTVFSSRFACPVSGFTIEEIEPRLFSFNNPHGACPACDGLGVETFFDPALVIPDERRTLAEGAVAPWTGAQSPYYDQTLQSLARHFKVSLRTSWSDLPARVREAILDGTGDEEVAFTYKDSVRSYTVKKPFEGVLRNLERRWRETDSAWVREEMARYQAEKPCAVCHGARLKPEALAVKVAAKNIAEASELSIRAALEWFRGVPPSLTPQRQEIARRILREIVERLAVPGRCGAGLPDAGARLGDAVGRREPAHPAGQPDRLRADRRALCARRAVDRAAPARQRTAAGDLAAAASARQHRAGGRARRGSDPRRRPRDRHGAGRGHRRRPRGGAGHAGGDRGESAVADRGLSVRPEAHRGAAPAPADAEGARGARGRRHRQQPEKRDGGIPARHLHLRHRRVRRRQIDAGGGHALQGGEPAADGLGRGAGAARRASTISNCSTRSSTSTSRRSAARRAATPPPTPTCSRRSATGSPSCRKAARAATSPAASASTSRAGAARRARATAC